MELSVKLPVFEGPLDLLLRLIAKNKVELVPQSLPDDASYWLDKGEFKLQISN